MLWQLLASVFVPGFIINRTVKASSFILKSMGTRKVVTKWLPVSIGLMTIPFIVKPVDHGVEYAMDQTVRKVITQYYK